MFDNDFFKSEERILDENAMGWLLGGGVDDKLDN